MQTLEDMSKQALEAIEKVNELAALDEIRVQFLGKKGLLTAQLQSLGKLEPEARKAAGQAINQVKANVQQALNDKKESLQRAALAQQLASERIDVSLPGRQFDQGGIHPVTRTIERIENFFS